MSYPRSNSARAHGGYALQAGQPRAYSGGAVASAPTNGAPHNQASPRMDAATQRRRAEQDRLIHDCYSKYIIDANGRKVPETSYQLHINIKEFSQFPSAPPPANAAAQQLDAVKDRVLVICTKSSGRVLLQKGKYNDIKDTYQIGRTWDLDELRRIARVASSGLVLTLNKDYYWKADEGLERLWKFVRILAVLYGNFVGRYPEITGWSLSELKLPPTPPRMAGVAAGGGGGGPDRGAPAQPARGIVLNEPIANPELLKSRSLKRKNLPKPVLPAQPPPPPEDLAQTHYGDMDFTANGKLPMKPMRPMKVDRASSNTKVDQVEPPNESKRGSHPYQTISGASPNVTADTSADSQGFVFSTRNSHSPERLQQYAREVGLTSPLRNYKPKPEGDTPGEPNLNEPTSPPRQQFTIPHAALGSPDFGIEEIEDEVGSDEEQEQPLFAATNGQKLSPSPEVIGESTQVNEEDTVLSSIQEIENFMESQLDVKRTKSAETESVFALDYNESSLGLNVARGGSEADVDEDTVLERDPEIEELLEEANWDIFDDAATLTKKLTKELNRVKFNNVQEVIALDFSGSADSTDLTTSLAEIHNLQFIFKKMETDLKRLSPEVHAIEYQSQGLQVTSVNKKLLYNDLKEILSNVNIDENDLREIETFSAFDRLTQIPAVEDKLLVLFDALASMRSNSEENDLSLMRALRQYRATYEQVTQSFIDKFVRFFQGQVDHLVSTFGHDLAMVSSHSLLRELNNLLIYSGMSLFVKDTSEADFEQLKSAFNLAMGALMSLVLDHRVVRLKLAGLSAALDYTIKNSRSSRSLRLSAKTKFKLRGSDHPSPDLSRTSTAVEDKPSSDVQDPRAIVELISYTTELILIVQHFVGEMFHYHSEMVGFSAFLKRHPFAERRTQIDNPSFDLTKSYANDVIANLTAIFGGYINNFIKKVAPQEAHIPLILTCLERAMEENRATNQEFLLFNFLRRSLDKLKLLWTKAIKTVVKLLDHSIVVAKCGVLPGIRNLNQLVVVAELSLDKPCEPVRALMDQSYLELTEACIHLFKREDPLLKNSEFDERERLHRNESILQNVFYLTEQLAVFSKSLEGLLQLRQRLEAVFREIEGVYMKRLLHKHVGKLMEFVDNYEALSQMGGQKKYNKKVVKSLLSNYTHKDIALRASEIHRKLEKHFITGGDMFEKDLLDRLWRDAEAQVADYFGRLDRIVRANFDRDIEWTVLTLEVHTIFSQAH